MSGFTNGMNPVFTKVWWEKNRPLKMRASGMGKALEAWAKNCTAPGRMPPEAIQRALNTCAELKKAIAAAKKKAGTDKAAVAVMDKYEVGRVKYQRSVEADHAMRVHHLETSRDELLKSIKAAGAELDKHLKEVKEFATAIASNKATIERDPRESVKGDRENAAMLMERIEQKKAAATARFDAADKLFKSPDGVGRKIDVLPAAAIESQKKLQEARQRLASMDKSKNELLQVAAAASKNQLMSIKLWMARKP